MFVFLCVKLMMLFTHQLFSEDDGTLATELVSHNCVADAVTEVTCLLHPLICMILAFEFLNLKGNLMVRYPIILADKVLQLGTNQSLARYGEER